MGATGSGTLDFGSVACNYTSGTVTGQTAILADSVAEAWIMADSTPDHNATEHTLVDMKLTCGDVVAGQGFTVYAYIPEVWVRGQFKFRWVWN